MRKFNQIIQKAINKFTNISDLQLLLPVIASSEEIRSRSDSEYLSFMERRIFQAGMRHSVVNDRWNYFEKIFWGFDPEKCQLISEELLEKHMSNKQLIRHWTKMKTIPVNSMAITELSQLEGGFGSFLANWPVQRTVDLWEKLATTFSRMGGNSAACFLRSVGVDTFILTEDVIAVLRREGIVDNAPTSKAAKKKVQVVFNQWSEESGRPLAHISKLLALSL